MYKAIERSALVLVFAGIVSCSAPTAPIAPRTQLETRELQTREFPTRDEKLVMKAVLNALQDEGFIISNAVPDLGLISARKERDVEHYSSALLQSIVAGPQARWRKAEVYEATANVTSHNDYTRVRLSLHQRVVDNQGATITTREVEEGEIYRRLFSKVDKSVFLQKEGI